VTLADLPLGTAARVTAIDASHDVIYRLMEMGLVRGTEVTVEKVAPLGYLLSIRKREASRFTVQVL